jgi:hypothetical protein
MKQDFDIGMMTAFDVTIKMKHKSFYLNPFQALSHILDDIEDKRDDCFHSTQKPILKSKYDKANLNKVIAEQKHLTKLQCADLRAIFAKQEKLFSGKRGHYPFKKMHLALIPGAQPVHAKTYPVSRKTYPVSRKQIEVFQKELECLVELGVLSRVGGTKWVSPTFITPKKDGCLHWVSDFSELNKAILCKIYPLPTIQDILKKQPGDKYFTKIDISMQYYTFKLSGTAKDLCVIIRPFGKY